MKVESINDEIRKYFNILCNDYPEWLNDYINTKEMQRIDKISISCGTDYSGIYNPEYFYSNLSHSIGVALIIWNFTKNKKATLAGLFHDISTPVFKHCIDFLNDDHEKQESTEEKTFEILDNSVEIKKLLKRDKILLKEVCDYKLYSIADNKSPKLSADRLEYTFSSGLTFKKVWNLELIEKIYSNIIVDINEEKENELMFEDKKICEEYINIISNLWPSWIDDNDRTVMQFLADITKEMVKQKFITKDDLYILNEEEIINKIINCDNNKIKKAFSNFQDIKEALVSNDKVIGKYSVYTKSKTRYINPYVFSEGRIYDISKKSKEKIDNYLALKKEGWTYFDFEFKI